MTDQTQKSSDPFRDGLLLFTNVTVYKLEDYVNIPDKALKLALRDSFSITAIATEAVNTIQYQRPLPLLKPTSFPAAATGFKCVFKRSFLPILMRRNIIQLPVFSGNQPWQLLLTNEQYRQAESIFIQMLQEAGSTYSYKYHLIRNQISQLIHLGMKAKQIQENDNRPGVL